MTILFFYDIEDDKLRLIIQKKALASGLMFIQKSIYGGKLKGDITQWQNQIEELIKSSKSKSHIVCLPIQKSQIDRLKQYGKNFEWKILFKESVGVTF